VPNLFVFTAGNPAAQEHLAQSIKNPVPADKVLVWSENRTRPRSVLVGGGKDGGHGVQLLAHGGDGAASMSRAEVGERDAQLGLGDLQIRG